VIFALARALPAVGNFREPPGRELRRTTLLGTRVNKELLVRRCALGAYRPLGLNGEDGYSAALFGY
jgi:hypothetical protein